MKIFFWQNINSIHQSTFFREFSKLSNWDVTLVVTEKIKPFRIEMGWSVPTIPNLKIKDISDNSNSFSDIIQNNARAIHVFSAINGFKTINLALNLAVKKDCKIGIFSESYDYRGFKGKMRYLRGFYHYYKYDKSINFILSTGSIAKNQFTKFGFNENKIYEWAYSVEPSSNFIPQEKNQVIQFCYAGSLIHRKGVDTLLEAIKILNNKKLNFECHLYCLKSKEELQQPLLSDFKNLKNIHFYEFLPNSELRSKISKHDCFILPSRHDGWGAVINEALAEGIKVIVSSKCGSSTLVNDGNGHVLNKVAKEDIVEKMTAIIQDGPLNSYQRNLIQKSYEAKVSGKVLAHYMDSILSHTFFTTIKSKPKTPWTES
ncbi:glycosyltransferase family 4 protein [Flavobacterium sp. ASW18X]|uniref:glycosyltransferase family 4 protein n=1 Tax=Flavobacterium sp. ASW18X TaxID=2572595 RepID=UPI0010AE7EBF|nr:glycosyltransferase [Flavobacterium sp. ASW18X]TKD65537.1 glycosyltransferase [Flavobacterium sp. ASW18X]